MRAGLGVAAVGAVGAAGPVLAPVLGGFAQLVPLLAKLVGVGGPVGLVIAGVAAGVGYLAVESRPVREVLSRLWGALERVWKATEPFREVLWDIAESTVSTVLEGVVWILEGVADGIKELADLWKDVVAGMSLLLDDIFGKEEMATLVAKGGGKPNRQPTPVNPGTEDVVSAYSRIQASVTRSGGEVLEDIAKQQLKKLGDIENAVLKIKGVGDPFAAQRNDPVNRVGIHAGAAVHLANFAGRNLDGAEPFPLNQNGRPNF